MRAVVLDGHLKSALTVVRVLGARGVYVSVGAERASASALHSRFTDETFRYCSPLADRHAYRRDVFSHLRTFSDKPVLYAFSDATLLPLLEERYELERLAYIAAPPTESVTIAFDKGESGFLAHRLGVPVPETHAIGSVEEAERLARSVRYPVVVKPRKSVVWNESGAGSFATARVVTASEELVRAARTFVSRGAPLLVQEYLDGGEYGAEYICRDGEVVLACAHKRVRSLYPSGGASVVKKTVPLETGNMDTYARMIIRSLLWTGPIMIEFKEDTQTGTLRMLEINGRFWGSLPLAVFAGANMPLAYFNIARGADPSVNGSYALGVQSMHILGYVRHLARVMFGSRPPYARKYPTRRAAIGYLMRRPGITHYDVLRRDDLSPFMWEMIDSLMRVL